jgi:hypothetical protein
MKNHPKSKAKAIGQGLLPVMGTMTAETALALASVLVV